MPMGRGLAVGRGIAAGGGIARTMIDTWLKQGAG